MPSGFVEVSGYSQTDLDAEYARGANDKEVAILGPASGTGMTDATQAQVLSGYTFSSRVAGNKQPGTMVNNGAVNPTALNPGGSYTVPNGFHNGSGVVRANANTGTYTIPSNQSGNVDLGASNLYRYINPTTFGNAKFSSGQSDGLVKAINNMRLGTSGSLGGYWGKPASTDYVTLWESKYIDSPKLLLLTGIAVAKRSADLTIGFRVTGASAVSLNSYTYDHDYDSTSGLTVQNTTELFAIKQSGYYKVEVRQSQEQSYMLVTASICSTSL